MANERKPLFQQVAERLIEQLEKGTSPFQRPWNEDTSVEMPYNPTTEKKYRGMNSLWLSMQGYADPRWMTFKQAQAKGWSVEKGAKGILINYVKTHGTVKLKDENGRPIMDGDGKQKTGEEKLERPIITSAHVFNADRIKGIPPMERTERQQEQKWEDMKRIEKLVRNSGVSIRHGGNHAFYNPVTDRITLPQKSQFEGGDKYYATLMHEMGHWTGHGSRLDRNILNSFGTTEYAKEELRAEIASLMIGADLNIGSDIAGHASYVKSWIAILKDDPFELYRASADAQKIRDFILEFEHKRAAKRGAEEAQGQKKETERGISHHGPRDETEERNSPKTKR